MPQFQVCLQFFFSLFSRTEMHVHLSCRADHFHFTPSAVEAQLTNTGFLSFTVCDSLPPLPPPPPHISAFSMFPSLQPSLHATSLSIPLFPLNLHCLSLFSLLSPLLSIGILYLFPPSLSASLSPL